MSSSADSQAPLLPSRQGVTDPSSASSSSPSPSLRPPSLAVLFGRATGHRGSSLLVRETAAREFEQRRIDWGYSTPVVALDILWNVAFVIISIVMLSCTTDERPNTPVRLWICGYAAQCLVHVVLVSVEFRRRTLRRIRNEERQGDQEYGYVNESEEEDEAASVERRGWGRCGFIPYSSVVLGFYSCSKGHFPVEDLVNFTVQSVRKPMASAYVSPTRKNQ